MQVHFSLFFLVVGGFQRFAICFECFECFKADRFNGFLSASNKLEPSVCRKHLVELVQKNVRRFLLSVF